MRSCDHILYQALVEILIPDVLRPVPSECHSPTLSLSSLWLPLATKISTVKTHLEVFVLAEMQWNSSVPPAALLWGDILYLLIPLPFKFGVLHITSPGFGHDADKKHNLDMGFFGMWFLRGFCTGPFCALSLTALLEIKIQISERLLMGYLGFPL